MRERRWQHWQLTVERDLDRGESHCTSDKQPNAGEWKNIYQALRKVEEDVGLENQLVVNQVQHEKTTNMHKFWPNKEQTWTWQKERTRRASDDTSEHK